MKQVQDWEILPLELPQPVVEDFQKTYVRTYYYAVYYKATDNINKIFYIASNGMLSFTFTGNTLSYSGASSAYYMDYRQTRAGLSASGTLTTAAKEVRVRNCLLPAPSEDAITTPLRILYGVGDQLYSTRSGELVPVGVLPLTQELFLSEGDTSINFELLVTMPEVRVYLFTLEPAHGGFRFTSSHVWKPQTIIQKKNFTSASAKKLTITAQVPSTAQLRVLLSNDDGVTWGTSDTVGNLTVRALSNIATEGMLYTAVNALSATALTKLISKNNTLKLALCIIQTTQTDRVTITSIRLDY